MISFLSGKVASVDLKSITILTASGVGYQVFPSLTALGVCQEGAEVQIDIFTIVREQEISLYGFASKEEKQLFEKLLTISGVGPKIALQIVSQPPADFIRAVEAGDDAYIAQTPGIGKKMAQKIIVELQGKVDLSQAAAEAKATPRQDEAIAALQGLGYSANIIKDILKSAPEGADTEALVTYFLKSNA